MVLDALGNIAIRLESQKIVGIETITNEIREATMTNDLIRYGRFSYHN